MKITTFNIAVRRTVLQPSPGAASRPTDLDFDQLALGDDAATRRTAALLADARHDAAAAEQMSARRHRQRVNVVEADDARLVGRVDDLRHDRVEVGERALVLRQRLRLRTHVRDEARYLRLVHPPAQSSPRHRYDESSPTTKKSALLKTVLEQAIGFLLMYSKYCDALKT